MCLRYAGHRCSTTTFNGTIKYAMPYISVRVCNAELVGRRGGLLLPSQLSRSQRCGVGRRKFHVWSSNSQRRRMRKEGLELISPIIASETGAASNSTRSPADSRLTPDKTIKPETTKQEKPCSSPMIGWWNSGIISIQQWLRFSRPIGEIANYNWGLLFGDTGAMESSFITRPEPHVTAFFCRIARNSHEGPGGGGGEEWMRKTEKGRMKRINKESFSLRTGLRVTAGVEVEVILIFSQSVTAIFPF